MDVSLAQPSLPVPERAGHIFGFAVPLCGKNPPSGSLWSPVKPANSPPNNKLDSGVDDYSNFQEFHPRSSFAIRRRCFLRQTRDLSHSFTILILISLDYQTAEMNRGGHWAAS